jgi:phosphoglucosamine mutase
LPTGDGLLTGIQILAMLRRCKKPLSWVHTLFKKYPQVLLNMRVKNKKPLETCRSIQREIARARKELADHGRVVVRYSGTEPLLRIMLEGPEQTQLQTFAERIARAARQTLGTA